MRGKLKLTIFIILSVVFISDAVYSATIADLQKLLSLYCVPTPEACVEYGGVLEPVYKAPSGDTPRCLCLNDEYLLYDGEQRKCRFKCAPGQFPVEVTKCPIGQYKFQIKQK